MMSLTACDGAGDGLVGADDDRDVRMGREHVLRRLQAERPSCRTTRPSATTLISGWPAIDLVERHLEGDVERGGLDRPDVADVAGVAALRSAQAVTTSSPILRPSSLGTKATLALRPSTWDSAVVLSSPRIWSMLPTAMPAAMASLTPSTRPAPNSGWVMIASYLPDAVASWSCFVWVGRVEVGVEDGQLGVAGGRGGLGGGEHRGVIAVGDRERQVGDLEGLGRRGRRRGGGAGAALAAVARRRWRPSRPPDCCRRRRSRLTPSKPCRRSRLGRPFRARMCLSSTVGRLARCGRVCRAMNRCQATLQDRAAASIIVRQLSVRQHRLPPERHGPRPSRSAGLAQPDRCVAWMNIRPMHGSAVAVRPALGYCDDPMPSLRPAR